MEADRVTGRRGILRDDAYNAGWRRPYFGSVTQAPTYERWWPPRSPPPPTDFLPPDH